MKSKKILVALLSALMYVCMVFGLVACTPAHTTHTFGNYKTSATQHWKECSCGEKSELTDHTFGSGTIVGEKVERTCTVCGYKKTDAIPNYSNAEILSNLASSANLANGEGVNLLIESEKLAIDGMTISYPYVSDEYEDLDTLCNISGDLSVEFFVGLDADGKLTANAAFVLDADAIRVSDNVTLSTATMVAKLVLKDAKLYTYLHEDSKYPGFPEELREHVEYNDTQSNFIDLEEMFTSSMGQESFMQMLPGIIEEILPILDSFYDDNLKDAIENIVDEYADDVADFIVKVAEYNFAIDKTADEIIIAFDKDKLIAQNQDLSTKTLVELYDMMYGENAFASLEETLISALDLTVDDVLMAIFTEDFTIEEVETLINTLIAAVYPNEGPVPTLEDLIKGDIVEMLNNEDFRKTEIFSLIAPAGTDKENIKAVIANVFDEFGGKTFYDVLALLMAQISGGQVGVDMEMVSGMTDEIFNLLGKVLTYKVTLESDGSFKSIDASIAVNGDIIEEVMNLLPLGANPDMEGPSFPFENLDAKITAKVTLGAFQNVMDVDYQEVIDLATADAE